MKICVVAGETSGDILGGALVKAARQHAPNCHFVGVGAEQMQAAGVELLFRSEALAVMGVVEVFSKFKQLRACMHQLVNYLKEQRPALLILIDYPGFNLRLAARAKKLGIKVMYYVSPQIWAWHYSRIHKIRRAIDHMAVLFPFEEKLYQKEGVPVSFVGHPIGANAYPTRSREASVTHFQLDPQKRTIGLLPGSREHEIKRLLPVMLNSVNALKKQFSDLQFILPVATSLPKSLLEAYDLRDITVVQNDTHNAINVCEAIIATSGTVTLEIALLGVPMVVIYQVNRLTGAIGRCFSNIRKMERGEVSFSLCNIVAEERLVPEFLQKALNEAAVTACISEWLTHPEKTAALKLKLQNLRPKLQGEQAAEKAADVALRLVGADSD